MLKELSGGQFLYLNAPLTGTNLGLPFGGNSGQLFDIMSPIGDAAQWMADSLVGYNVTQASTRNFRIGLCAGTTTTYSSFVHFYFYIVYR